MVTFDSTEIYLTSAATLEERLTKVRALIDALLLTAAGGAGARAAYDTVEMEDGQTRVYTKYRSINDVLAGIKVLEKMEQRYLNQLNGHMFRAVNSKNMR